MGLDAPGWSGVVHGDWTNLPRIRALLNAGAEADGIIWGNRRPLHVAAEEGSPEVVAELAGRVTDIDSEERGRSALWSAVYHGRSDNARILLAAGADPWRPMMAGWSPGRLSLAGPVPDLFPLPAGEGGLTDDERAVAAEAPRLAEIFAGHCFEGLGLACVAGISATEAVRRLDATPFAVTEEDPSHEPPLRGQEGTHGEIIGATGVPGGCILTQPWGYTPQMPGVLAALSPGTVTHGLYANPKSGDQGRIFRDGSAEGSDLHPGGDPRPDATSREILVGYLTRGNAIAFCCAYAGVRPPDIRAVTGPPDIWLGLPERDWRH